MIGAWGGSELAVSGVYKAVHGRPVLRGVSFRLGQGISALIGPNGAGKSTLLRLLATLETADSGEIAFGGRAYRGDMRAIRAEIGYMAQTPDFPPALTSLRLLRYLAAIRGLPPHSADSGLEALRLTGIGRRRVGSLSGGTQQLLSAAQALMGNPRLLVMDEPTRGLAPEERGRFWRAVRGAAPKIALFSTHTPDDVERYAEQALVLRAGEIVFSGSVEALRQEAAGQVWAVRAPLDQVEALQRVYRVSRVIMMGDGATVRVVGARPEGLPAEPLSPTVEDAYLLLVGGNMVRG